MTKLFLIALIFFGGIFLHAQRYYPDSAHVMGYTRFWAATGEASGNRVTVRDSQGNIHAVYAYAIGAPYADSSEIYYVFSTNDGFTWSEPQNISWTDSFTSYEPNLAIDSQDRLHCVWKQYYEDTATSYLDVDVYYAQNDGSGWTTAINISNQSYGANACYSSMVVDSQDHVHMVWDMDLGFSANWDIFYSYYNDTVWSEPYQVSNTPYDDAFPAMAIDSNDHLHMVWRQWSTDGPIYYSFYDGISWSSSEIIASMTDGKSSYPCIVADSQNLPRVIFGCALPSDSGNIYYTAFDGVSWSAPLNLSNTINHSAYTSLSIDSLDQLYVVWSEKTPFPNQEIYYRTYNGTIWSGVMNLTQDTSLSWCPKLGNPVKGGAVDLVWVDSWAGTRSVMYMGLSLTGIAEDAPGYNPGASLMLCIHPNPFCDRVAIEYANEGSSQLKISIYDAAGRLVRQWCCPDTERSGRILWLGDDERGCIAAPGVYFVKLERGGHSVTKKIIKTK